MDISELKEYIRECISLGNQKTEIYHKLEKEGISFELARDLVDRFYDEYSKGTKKRKIKKIKGVKVNYFRRLTNIVKNLEMPDMKLMKNFKIKKVEFEKAHIVVLIAIVFGFIWGKTELKAGVFDVVFAILIAGNMFYITDGKKEIKNQIISLLSTIICIFIARYMFFYGDAQVRIEAIKAMESFKTDELVLDSLLSWNVMSSFIEESFKISFKTMWYIVSLLVAFEFSHGDMEKIKAKLKKS